MKELVMATTNAGKIREIKHLLPHINLWSLHDIAFTDTINEPFETFEENAFIKANTIYNKIHKPVFADDSGICVSSLQDAPGVHSAYYSGERNDEANLQKVLQLLGKNTQRGAYYKAVICLIWQGKPHYFTGICNGKIAQQKAGNEGFGYDPIFIPDGFNQTFGALPLDIKNEISHRGKAIRQMIDFINQISD